jgi:iron complex outermembrane receptor protein/hemoglobin/transferrin/lactoferrin receptor protein
LSVRPWLDLALDYGIDTYHDWVDSAAWISFTDILITERRSRGQYLDGSQYTSGGAFLELAVRLGARLKLRGGGRFSWVVARAPDDPESGSRAVDRTWLPVVGHAGLEWRPWDALSILINYDRSFRAPNLDDLTSRQQTGPGFQFENADLGPERTDSLEVGVRLSAPLFVELWAFRTALHGAMIKSPKQDGDCPPDTPACQASWTKLQLVNAEGESEIWGVEAALLAELPLNLEGRATLAWTWGQGPNLTPRPADPAVPYQEKVPLSRIPPLNGTVELIWRHPSGFTLSADLRWATRQDRLALADLSDERIPKGGTPGFAVFDFRFAYRVADLLTVSLVAENLTDAAYRTHGSSVNGPGRGLVLLLDLGPLWRWGN